MFDFLFDAFALYSFLHAMRQLQLLLAKVTLKCSYCFVRLLPEVRLSCRSLQEFSLSCFHVSCHSRSIIPVCPTTAATTYRKPNNNAKKLRLESEFLFLHYLYLATNFLHLVTLISLIVAKR